MLRSPIGGKKTHSSISSHPPPPLTPPTPAFNLSYSFHFLMKTFSWPRSTAGEWTWQSRSLFGQLFFTCSFSLSCQKFSSSLSFVNLLFSCFLSHNLPQIMLLTDPEIESSLLISSDEGATYQKYRLNFYIQSLLFHPKQEDWILAYSQDQKVSVITLLETVVHGCPREQQPLSHLCISSQWSGLLCAVAWTPCLWGKEQECGSQAACLSCVDVCNSIQRKS